MHEEGYYDDHDIELRLSCPVQAIELQLREVVLASGERLRFDALLLATGAAPRRLSVPELSWKVSSTCVTSPTRSD